VFPTKNVVSICGFSIVLHIFDVLNEENIEGSVQVAGNASAVRDGWAG
jgi:hypothetical protein